MRLGGVCPTTRVVGVSGISLPSRVSPPLSGAEEFVIFTQWGCGPQVSRGEGTYRDSAGSRPTTRVPSGVGVSQKE
jgi:hypothetical protein